MNNIKEYIIEKLKIGSKSKINTDTDLRDLSHVKFHAFWETTFKTPKMEQDEWDKVNQYFNKKSNPQRLVNSIKDRAKLVRRWWMFTYIGWEEAAQIFRNEIIDRKYYNADELDKCILDKYEFLKRNSPNSKTIENYEKYLEINNVKYK